MNINYIIGLVGALAVFLLGCVLGINIGPNAVGDTITFAPGNLWNFFDAASIFIVIGCTMFIVCASFPGSTLKAMPKHFGIILKNKLFDPVQYIEQLVELAQIARKNGLLSLEEKANEQTDPFFKQAILENDIECMSARHEDAAAMYDKASSVAPAFGMVGTLVGLINMLNNMSLDGGGASSLGKDMGTALITTLYGCIMAHMIFGPVAQLLRVRDAEEVLCKQIIVEGVMAIQAGENPKALKERLMTYMSQRDREMGDTKGGGE